jgi:hypothetical protein
MTENNIHELPSAKREKLDDEFRRRTRRVDPTPPFRAFTIFIIMLACFLVVALNGCAVARPPFVCSDPTDPQQCALEARLYELENRVDNQVLRERMGRHRDEAAKLAKQTCEHAHGSGSQLCR